jgi:hypothetical protein
MNVVDAIDSPVSEHYLSWVTNDEVDPEIFIFFYYNLPIFLLAKFWSRPNKINIKM